ncbi:hypothetical protein [Streptomyces sp. NBC_00096]|uniref:hypothetical protein n=1 Tax=Streptomyces sp. NBC_00096 TaxID=2975650 RepID=UPI00324FC99C
MSAAEQGAFCTALFRFEELSREFTADSLRLERIVLRTGVAHGESGDTFQAPEATLNRGEIWRTKFLLLDICYGEPTGTVTRITGDLTHAQGRLHRAWELALQARASGFRGPLPLDSVDDVHRTVAAYGLESFRPNMAKCRALWGGLPASERALLSSDVTTVMAAVTERLNALESAFSAVEHSAWVLQTAEHSALI